MTAVRERVFSSPTEKLMMMVLCDYIDADDVAWPGSQTLAEDVGVDSRTIRRYLTRLEEFGAIRRQPRWGRKGSRGRAADEIEFVWAGFQRLPLVGAGSREPDELPDRLSTNSDDLPDNPGGFTGQSGNDLPDNPGTLSSYRTPQVEPPLEPPRFDTSSFERFWEIYPQKTAKVDARKAWAKLDSADEVAAIAGAERYRDDPNREPEFTAYPATWLRAGRWEDDPLPARTNGRKPTAAQNSLTALGNVTRMLQAPTETRGEL